MIKLKPIRENLYQEQTIYRKIKEYYDDILFSFIDKVFKENRFENDKIDRNDCWHDTKGWYMAKVDIDTSKTLNGRTEEKFRADMLDELYKLRNKEVENKSLNTKITIRISGIKKYESFSADINKLHIIPYLKKLLSIVELTQIENTYTPEKEKNIKKYYKGDVNIKIDKNPYSIYFTVKEDDKGHYFWDAQIKARRTVSVTNQSVGGLSTISIIQNDLNVKIIPLENKKIRLENAIDLRYYILQGYLRYRDGFFTIKRNLPNKVAMELEKMGAIYSRKRRGYYLKANKVPPAILQAAAMVNIRDQERLTKISDYLRGLTETEAFITSKVDFSPEVIKIGADLDRQFKTSMTGLEIPANMTEFQKSEIARNYTNNLNYYIKKWVPKEIQSLREDLQPLTLGGYRAEALEEIIQKHKGVSERKAKFLARQETKLLVAQYRKNRFKEAGVTQYIWSTVLDGKERQLHRELNGHIFSWDEPPIIDARTGEKGAPGEAYNCRCIAIPVVENMRFANG